MTEWFRTYDVMGRPAERITITAIQKRLAQLPTLASLQVLAERCRADRERSSPSKTRINAADN